MPLEACGICEKMIAEVGSTRPNYKACRNFILTIILEMLKKWILN